MEKFSRFFPDQETVDDWCNVWGEELAGLTGEQIKFGLSILARDYAWPPTIAEFMDCCKALPKPIFPLLKAPKHGVTPHAEACMKKIREMFAHPKPAGSWWADQVLELQAKGKPTSSAAFELAKRAKTRAEGGKALPIRDAGWDDEEVT